MRKMRKNAEATSVWRDCIILELTATNCNTLEHMATHYNTQNVMKLNEYEAEDVWRNCNAVQHAVQHAATRCNTLQHASTRRNTLQHAATHRIYEGWQSMKRVKRSKVYGRVTFNPTKELCVSAKEPCISAHT